MEQNAFMKTSLDLPDALVEEIKSRAEYNRQKLDDAVVDLLRKGLTNSVETPDALVQPLVKTHPKTGLPYVECPHRASADEEMTPDRVADLLLQQEVAWHHEAG
jgi:hypothetical protein